MQFLGVMKWCIKHVCWKFLKSERFLVVLREHIIFNVKWVTVCKMSEVFWAKLYSKRDLFCKFLLALRLSSRKSDIKNFFDDIQWNVWTNIKSLHARNNIFKKWIANMRFLNHLYFGLQYALLWSCGTEFQQKFLFILIWMSFQWRSFAAYLFWMHQHVGIFYLKSRSNIKIDQVISKKREKKIWNIQSFMNKLDKFPLIMDSRIFLQSS